VPHEINLSLLQRLMDQSGKQRFLVDGFPPSMDQAFAFEKRICQCAFVLNFNLADSEMRNRLSGHSEEAISQRLASFHAQTVPVLQFYEQFHKVKNVDAVGSVEQVWTAVKPLFL
jgi:UMP-CMP kinase